MSQDKTATDQQNKIRSILENLTKEEQQFLSRVVSAEREKLYMQRPRGINEELWRALTETIK